VGAALRIDADGAVVATAPLRFSPLGVAAGEGAVWVTNGPGDAVSRLDPVRGQVARTLAVGDEPAGIAVGAGSVWVANRRDGTVSRIDPASGTVVETIDVGGRPQDVAVGAGAVWVTVHPAPGSGDEPLDEEDYGAAVLEISERAGVLSDDLWQPIVRAVHAGGGFAEAIESDPELIRHVIVYHEDAIADLEAISPPDRFAADHVRYVGGLREQVALFERLRGAIETRDAEAFEQAWSELPALLQALRLDLSIEFKQLTAL
jgi:YVTN family beta-propeller protein